MNIFSGTNSLDELKKTFKRLESGSILNGKEISKYHAVLKEKGLCLSGMSPDGELVEFIELKDHPYFVATQAHPELKSSLQHPAPLFMGLVKAAKK